MTPLELKILRKSRGLTQQQAADLLGISRATFRRRENQSGDDCGLTEQQIKILRDGGFVCPNCGFVC